MVLLCALTFLQTKPKPFFTIMGVSKGLNSLRFWYVKKYAKCNKKCKKHIKNVKKYIKTCKIEEINNIFAKFVSPHSLEYLSFLQVKKQQKSLRLFAKQLKNMPKNFLFPLAPIYKYRFTLCSICASLQKNLQALSRQKFRHIQGKCVVELQAWFLACDMLLQTPFSLQQTLKTMYTVRKPMQKECKVLPILLCVHIVTILQALMADVFAMHKQIQKGKRVTKFFAGLPKKSPAFIYGAYGLSKAQIALVSVQQKLGIKAAKHVVKDALLTQNYIEHMLCWLFEIYAEQQSFKQIKHKPANQNAQAV